MSPDCTLCQKHRKTCKKGDMYHNVMSSFGLVKESPAVEVPNAAWCRFYDEIET